MVRLKNRYIVIEVNPRDQNETDTLHPFKLSQTALNQTVQGKVDQLHGDFGAAAILAGFSAKYVNPYTRIGIIRCRSGPHKLITSTIPFITQVDSCQVSVNILYVGATIKKCFNFVKLHQQRKSDEYCIKLESDEAKKSLKEALMNFGSM
ncbi:unnamed protein product [Ceutorhynchus assimilis]|uniref:Ribonuclease P/MRP protein subunit POP5 n=1 Tax=Ceutorhynchus assimilis TaxID=467358 RepID=A0A9N9MK14_9CUCU|nr:unnamed protein product [Ceutorhynchus assimilis]